VTHSGNTPESERGDKRIHIALPIRVLYLDKDMKPRVEMACTYDISTHGARVSGLQCIQETGEIVTVERGRSKALCRVAWIGDESSPLRRQVGLQCVDPEDKLWEGELRNLQEIYDPIIPESQLYRLNSAAVDMSGNRRRHDRYTIEGLAELLRGGAANDTLRGEVKNVSEFGCLVAAKGPLSAGTDIKLMLQVGGQKLSLKGRVRHSDPGLGSGIEFREIRKGDRQLLQYLVQKLAREKAKLAAVTGTGRG